MACFLVSAAEAVVVTVAEKAQKKAEEQKVESGEVSVEDSFHVPFSRKLKWLRNMLWGGAFLLLFEHIWHGEVQPFFPFLTAMESSADTVEMLKEMATVGVTMALLVTAVWGVMCFVTSAIEKRVRSERTSVEG